MLKLWFSFRPRKTAHGYHEGESIGLILTGLRNPHDWSLKDSRIDVHDLKGEIESLIGKFSLDKIEYNIYHSTSNTLIDEAVGIEYQGVLRGYFGRISGNILKVFDIPNPVYAAEIDLALFGESARLEKKYRDVPKYPPVHRDLAFIFNESVAYGELEKVIREYGKPLVQKVTFFDVYRGEKIGKGKKSVAVSLELLSVEKTLTQPEIDKAVSHIVQAVENNLHGVLRS